MMKKETEDKLKQAEDICDKEGYSTEYMLQFMQDYAAVSRECVMNYIRKNWRQVE
jgi:hypothetical protein